MNSKYILSHIMKLSVLVVTILGATACDQSRDRYFLRGLKPSETHTGNGHGVTGQNGKGKNVEPIPEPECIKLSPENIKLLSDPLLSQEDKNKLIGAIFKTIRGKSCPGVIAFLNSIYKNDPVSDQVNQTVTRLERMKSKDVVALAIENPELPLEAEVLWKLAKNIEIQKTDSPDKVVVLGEVKYRRQRVRLVAAFEAKDFDGDTSAEKMAALTKGLFITFKADGDEITGTTQVPSKDVEPLKVFDDVAKKVEQDRKKTASAPVKKDAKLNFAVEDLDVIKECGGAQTRQMVRGAISEHGASVTVNGLALSDNDEFSPNKLGTDLKSLVDGIIDDASPESSNGFLIPVGAETMYYVVAKSSRGADFNNASSVLVTVAVHSLKLGDTVKKIEDKSASGDITVSYQAQVSDLTLEKEFEFVFDPNAAYWLKIRSDRILQCLGRKQIASDKTSFRAVESALFYIILQDKLSYLTKKQ